MNTARRMAHIKTTEGDMTACFIRYEIGRFKKAQFQNYARNWGQAIPQLRRRSHLEYLSMARPRHPVSRAINLRTLIRA